MGQLYGFVDIVAPAVLRVCAVLYLEISILFGPLDNRKAQASLQGGASGHLWQINEPNTEDKRRLQNALVRATSWNSKEILKI